MKVLKAVAGLIGVVLMLLLVYVGATEKRTPATMTVEAKFDEEWALIQKYFVREIPNTPEAKRECFEKVLRGGIATCLDDRHSDYYSAADMRQDTERMNGEFQGIGAVLASYNGQVMIGYFIDGSPAALSGEIQPGDIIMAVDGEDVHDKTMMYAISKIRGTEGTKVAITFKRGDKLLPPVVLARAKIEIPSVKVEKIDGRTTLIKVSAFEYKTHIYFAKAIADALNDGKGGIDFSRRFIIDLRNNPGGLIDSVQLMATMFASSPEDIIVVMKTRDGEQLRKVGDAKSPSFLRHFGGTLSNTRTVVLVNEDSASAAEIFSGILQQWGRAKVVGVKTYGKGSVQRIVSLKDGSGLHITTAEYLVGGKRTHVNGIGITPDVSVENIPLCGEEAKTFRGKKKPLVDLVHDAQLRAALKVLDGK